MRRLFAVTKKPFSTLLKKDVTISSKTNGCAIGKRIRINVIVFNYFLIGAWQKPRYPLRKSV